DNAILVWDTRFDNRRGKGGWVESVPVASIANAHGEPLKASARRKSGPSVNATVTSALYLRTSNATIASCGSSDSQIKYW
ncbi:hypothetical protein HDU91_003293, partial [Kappamyces sp. JEL0680]